LRPRDIAELLALAALWGASFLFMRVAVPAFGPIALVFLRVAGAALVLVPLLALRGELATLRRHWGRSPSSASPTRRCRSSASPMRR
jgi:drug/metabolite transporter (DMT)-like permease